MLNALLSLQEGVALAADLTYCSLLVLETNDRKGDCLSIVSLSTIWSDEWKHRDVFEMKDISEPGVQHIVLSSQRCLGRGAKIALYEDEAPEGQVSDYTLTILSYQKAREGPRMTLKYNLWRIHIPGSFSDDNNPRLPTVKHIHGHFETMRWYASVCSSTLTRSGRFFIVMLDMWGGRRLYASSFSRLASGDTRLIPVAVPYKRRLSEFDRIAMDEYHGDIYWTFLGYPGFVSTSYGTCMADIHV